MKRSFSSIVFTLFLCLTAFSQNLPEASIRQSSNGKFSCETVEGDPIQARIYTLKNGLKVYCSPNIYSNNVWAEIVVRAGSAHDPEGKRGTAELLSKLMRNGTDRIGTRDFQAEQPILKQLHEKLNELASLPPGPDREALFPEIEALSTELLEWGIPGDYQRTLVEMGTQGLNEHTTPDATHFMSYFSPGMLEGWLKMEAERFRNPVFRFFESTRAEMAEDIRSRHHNPVLRARQAAAEKLFMEHPYGKSAGTGHLADLPNIAPEDVRNFFLRHYAPNNMAIVLSGKFDPEKAIALIDKYFKGFQQREVPMDRFPEEDRYGRMDAELTGPFEDRAYLIYRTPPVTTREGKVVELVHRFMEIIPNAPDGTTGNPFFQAGGPRSEFHSLRDFSFYSLSGIPSEGEPLHTLEPRLDQNLLFFRTREIEEFLLPVAINQWELQEMTRLRGDGARVHEMAQAFAINREWNDWVGRFQTMRSISLDEIMQTTSEVLSEDRVTLLQMKGPEEPQSELLLPDVARFPTGAGSFSDFCKKVKMETSGPEEELMLMSSLPASTEKLGKEVQLIHFPNDGSEIFHLQYIWPFGTRDLPGLEPAAEFFNQAGTDDFPPDAFRRLLWHNALNMKMEVSLNQTVLTVSGLQKKFEDAIRITERKLSNIFPDSTISAHYMQGFGKTGPAGASVIPPMRKQLGMNLERELYAGGIPSEWPTTLSFEDLNAAAYTSRIVQLSSHAHNFAYAGPANASEVKDLLERSLEFPGEFTPSPGHSLPKMREVKKDTVFLIPQNATFFTVSSFIRAREGSDAIMITGQIARDLFQSLTEEEGFLDFQAAKSSIFRFEPPYRSTEHPWTLEFHGRAEPTELTGLVNGIQELFNNPPREQQAFDKTLQFGEDGLRNLGTSPLDFLKQGLFSYRNNMTLLPEAALKSGIERLKKEENALEAWKGDYEKVFGNQPRTWFIFGPVNKIDRKSLENLGTVVLRGE